MAEWTKMLLGKQARELGFVRDTYEKVCRLTEILKFFETDDVLGKSMADRNTGACAGYRLVQAFAAGKMMKVEHGNRLAGLDEILNIVDVIKVDGPEIDDFSHMQSPNYLYFLWIPSRSVSEGISHLLYRLPR